MAELLNRRHLLAGGAQAITCLMALHPLKAFSALSRLPASDGRGRDLQSTPPRGRLVRFPGATPLGWLKLYSPGDEDGWQLVSAEGEVFIPVGITCELHLAYDRQRSLLPMLRALQPQDLDVLCLLFSAEPVHLRHIEHLSGLHALHLMHLELFGGPEVIHHLPPNLRTLTMDCVALRHDLWCALTRMGPIFRGERLITDAQCRGVTQIVQGCSQRGSQCPSVLGHPWPGVCFPPVQNCRPTHAGSTDESEFHWLQRFNPLTER